MDTKTYQYSLEDLPIEKERIYNLLGYELDAIPDPFPEMIDLELKILSGYCNIQGVTRLVDSFQFDDSKKNIFIRDTEFNVGRGVSKYLKNTEQVVLFLCTAGEGVSKRIKELYDNGEMMEGFIADVIGSTIVETAMDQIHESLKDEMNIIALKTTNRYSPGYCQWDVAEQHKLFTYFPDKCCGITLTDSAVMQPTKSVSGIIGVGKEVEFTPYSCDSCNSVHCLYRNKKNVAVG